MRGASKIWFKRSSYSGAHTALTWQKKKERRNSWTGWYANSEVNLLDTLLGSRVRQMGDTRPLALTAVYRLSKNSEIKHSSWWLVLIKMTFRFSKTVDFEELEWDS